VTNKGKNMKFIKSLLALSIVAIMFNSSVLTVLADGTEAEAEANAEVICETGDYGQAINCKAKSDASAKVVTRHEPINTGLGAQGVAMAVGTIATGAAAVVAKFRLR